MLAWLAWLILQCRGAISSFEHWSWNTDATSSGAVVRTPCTCAHWKPTRAACVRRWIWRWRRWWRSTRRNFRRSCSSSKQSASMSQRRMLSAVLCPVPHSGCASRTATESCERCRCQAQRPQRLARRVGRSNKMALIEPVDRLDRTAPKARFKGTARGIRTGTTDTQGHASETAQQSAPTRWLRRYGNV